MFNLQKRIQAAQKKRRQFQSEKNGNVSVMFAVMLPVTLLGSAVAIDISSTYSVKQSMQDALDAGVLAAALEAKRDNFENFGENAYESNLSEGRLLNIESNFQRQTINGTQKIVGTATGTLPLMFSDVLNRENLNITVNATAFVGYASAPPCIIALDQAANPGIRVNSGTRIFAPDCEMHVHATTSNALSANAGINVDLTKTCVAGRRIRNNSRGQIGNVETNCAAAADPFLGRIPLPASSSCDYQNGNYDNAPNGEIILRPGVYCGWHNFNNSNIAVTFEPGLYVIQNGGWNVNGGNWSGDDITFYFNDTSIINFNSNVRANFTAPDEGDYAGIFMTERPGISKRHYSINSGSDFNFEGAIYIPSKTVQFNGSSNLVVRKTQLVADRISFSGAIAFEPMETSTNEVKLDPYLSD